MSMSKCSPICAAVLVTACGARSPAPAVDIAPAPRHASSDDIAVGLDAPQGDPLEGMVRIPEATYRMGSEVGDPDERPVHAVRVASFDIDRTEVTVTQYARCVREGLCVPAPTLVDFPGATAADQQLLGSECNDDRLERRDHPENCVDWSMADAYCRWAGKRLPTEEEWEYAACAGECERPADGHGRRPTIQGIERWPFTTRVAARAPNAFGVYDMAGNVWEWTASHYCPYEHPGCGDPRRVIRGGSWVMVDYLFVRLTDRSPSDAATRATNVGFRCVRSASAAGDASP